MFLPITTILVASCVLAAGDDRYPRSDLLIEARELLGVDAAKRPRIVDVRSAEKYAAGHVPGAAWVDVAEWSKSFARSQEPKNWADRLGAVGIADLSTPVVVYGDDVREAARVWWILRYWGMTNVRLLNGGWQSWLEAKGPVDKTSTERTKQAAKLRPDASRLATKEQLLKDLKEKKLTILDVRSQGEFCGDTSLAKRGGAIPGARHLEWSETIEKKSQRFKAPSELAKLFKEANIDLDRPAVTYCQSGGRAAVMAFALELMGAKDVRNYYRSWAEWGNADDTPVVKPAKK